jgi:adhesin transport system outer membrane protein
MVENAKWNGSEMARVTRVACRIGLTVASVLLVAGCANLKSGSLEASCAGVQDQDLPPAASCVSVADRAKDPDVTGSIPETTVVAKAESTLLGLRPTFGADSEANAAITRAEVLPQMKLASLGVASDARSASLPSLPVAPVAEPASGKYDTITLGDAVAIAVLSHPLMGAQAAKVKGAIADQGAADSLYKPHLEISAGAGQGTLGSYNNFPATFDRVDVNGAKRGDLGFTFRQLVYDFGATSAEAARNRSVIDSEQLRLADQAEEIALRTVNAYLNLLEQKELLASIGRSVARERGFADLVRMSERNGNSTRADLDRIQTKVIEAEAVRTDIEAGYQVAMDEFRRLTGLAPKQVRRPTSVVNVPAGPEAAIAAARISNPSILALKASGDSMSHQLTGLKAQNLPRIDLQSDGLLKHYAGGPTSARQGVLDMRAMVTLSYKIFDGGLLASQTDRVRQNILANDFKQLDEQETLELNLRRLYQSLSSSSVKRAAAVRGLTTARSVTERYVEQFDAGKRSVFELLDSETTVFAMDKNRISGEFEEIRARYGILRHMGALTANIAGRKS